MKRFGQRGEVEKRMESQGVLAAIGGGAGLLAAMVAVVAAAAPKGFDAEIARHSQVNLSGEQKNDLIEYPKGIVPDEIRTAVCNEVGRWFECSDQFAEQRWEADGGALLPTEAT